MVVTGGARRGARSALSVLTSGGLEFEAVTAPGLFPLSSDVSPRQPLESG